MSFDPFTTCTNRIIHLFYPPKICIGIVFNFSWDIFMSQEKLQTTVMQKFWGVTEVYYGIVQVVHDRGHFSYTCQPSEIKKKRDLCWQRYAQIQFYYQFNSDLPVCSTNIMMVSTDDDTALINNNIMQILSKWKFFHFLRRCLRLRLRYGSSHMYLLAHAFASLVSLQHLLYVGQNL